MNLTVLSVAYPFAKVREDTPGGAEQVLLAIDKALSEAGHVSIVAALKGSRVRGRLLSLPPVAGTIDEDARSRMYSACRETISFALQNWKIDIIHAHGIDFARYLPHIKIPSLVTLHLPLSWYKEADLTYAGPDINFNCVSASQLKSCPPRATVSEFIENGVDTVFFAPVLSVRGYALSLGRICPEKGYHQAMDAARMAGVPFALAGSVFPYREHEEYFTKEISPRLGPGSHFIGAVAMRRKRRLLAGAKCLLVPSLAPETGSLVAMEALACGTPVVAFRAGALKDIVEHGRTGYLVNDAAGMAAAIKKIDRISRQECRETALRRFSSVEMTSKYIELYRRIVCGPDAKRKISP